MQSSVALSFGVTRSSVVTQVGLYHDQQTEDGGSSKENRNIYSESMPRRVGSFYRGWFSHTVFFFLSFTAPWRSRCQLSFKDQMLHCFLLQLTKSFLQIYVH